MSKDELLILLNDPEKLYQFMLDETAKPYILRLSAEDTVWAEALASGVALLVSMDHEANNYQGMVDTIIFSIPAYIEMAYNKGYLAGYGKNLDS